MRRKLLWLVGILAIAVILLIVSALLNHSQSERTVADTFVNQVLAGQASESYASFSKAAQSQQSKQAWTETVGQLSSFFKGKKPSYTLEQKPSATETDVHYSIVGSDGLNYVFMVVLKKTGNAWQVFSFQSVLKDTNDSGSGGEATP